MKYFLTAVLLIGCYTLRAKTSYSEANINDWREVKSMEISIENIDCQDDYANQNEPLTGFQSDVASRIADIIVDKLGVDYNEVVVEANFMNDLGADSLDLVELQMEIEKEFDIQIPDDEASQLETVGQLISYVQKNAKDQ